VGFYGDDCAAAVIPVRLFDFDIGGFTTLPRNRQLSNRASSEKVILARELELMYWICQNSQDW